jgi:hypothetical protein
MGTKFCPKKPRDHQLATSGFWQGCNDQQTSANEACTPSLTGRAPALRHNCGQHTTLVTDFSQDKAGVQRQQNIKIVRPASSGKPLRSCLAIFQPLRSIAGGLRQASTFEETHIEQAKERTPSFRSSGEDVNSNPSCDPTIP